MNHQLLFYADKTEKTQNNAISLTDKLCTNNFCACIATSYAYQYNLLLYIYILQIYGMCLFEYSKNVYKAKNVNFVFA